MTRRKNRTYTNEFKQEAVALVTEQGYSVPKAAASLGITDKLLYNWKAKFEAEQSGEALSADERVELIRLRKENKELRMEKDILKKASALLLCSFANIVTSLSKTMVITLTAISSEPSPPCYGVKQRNKDSRSGIAPTATMMTVSLSRVEIVTARNVSIVQYQTGLKGRKVSCFQFIPHFFQSHA